MIVNREGPKNSPPEISGLVLKPIPGRPGYFADSEGQIRRSDGSIVKARLRSVGYYSVFGLNVYRLVALAFHGEPPPGKNLVRHLNGLKTDNRPVNLQWGDKRENSDDAIRLGEKCMGEAHPNSRLTEAKVLEMRTLYIGGATVHTLARDFGVAGATAKRALLSGWPQVPHVLGPRYPDRPVVRRQPSNIGGRRDTSRKPRPAKTLPRGPRGDRIRAVWESL